MCHLSIRSKIILILLLTGLTSFQFAPNRQTPEQKNQLTPKPLLTMHEIAATVTTAAPTELKLTGNWPVDWLQAPGIRSIQIQRKLLANESLRSPLVAVREEEILGNRANWPPFATWRPSNCPLLFSR
jgi:hypothetical protein